MAGALLGKYALMGYQQIAKSPLKRDICGPSLNDFSHHSEYRSLYPNVPPQQLLVGIHETFHLEAKSRARGFAERTDNSVPRPQYDAIQISLFLTKYINIQSQKTCLIYRTIMTYKMPRFQSLKWVFSKRE